MRQFEKGTGVPMRYILTNATQFSGRWMDLYIGTVADRNISIYLVAVRAVSGPSAFSWFCIW
jgi:hypothetical protein